MVIAALVKTFYPSHRDLRQRRRVQARSLLISFASDLDIVSEWAFYFDTVTNSEVSRHLKTAQLIFCLIGLTTWLALASDGRLISPFLKVINIPFFSTADLMLLTVLVEDFPQVVLSLLIENEYDGGIGGGLSKFAMINVLTAWYDIMIKLSEAFDERNDVHHTGAWLAIFRGHGAPISCVVAVDGPLYESDASRSSFSTNGIKRLITGSYDNTCKLWETSTSPRKLGYEPVNGRCIRTYTGHSDSVNCVASLVQKIFVSGSSDWTLRSWNVETGECLQTFHGHNGEVTSVCRFDDSTFVSGSVDHTLKLWHLEIGNCLRTFIGHVNWVTSVAALRPDVGPDGQKIHPTMFISGSSDKTARLWEAKSGKCTRIYAGHFKSVSAVAVIDHDTIVTGSSDDTLRIWNLSSGLCTLVFQGHRGRVFAVDAIDQETFVSAAGDGTARVWDVGNGECLRTFEVAQGGGAASVLAIANFDGKTFVTGSWDHAARLWAIKSPERFYANVEEPLRQYFGCSEDFMT